MHILVVLYEDGGNVQVWQTAEDVSEAFAMVVLPHEHLYDWHFMRMHRRNDDHIPHFIISDGLKPAHHGGNYHAPIVADGMLKDLWKLVPIYARMLV